MRKVLIYSAILAPPPMTVSSCSTLDDRYVVALKGK